MIFDTSASIFHPLEKTPFSLESWLDYWYPTICTYLQIDSKKDYGALKSIVNVYPSKITVNELHHILKGRSSHIFAPGPSLSENILHFKKSDKQIIIAVDGATTFLLEKNILPDIIITDLDGTVEDQITAMKEGAYLLVHVHGDNKSRLERFLPHIYGTKYILTTQTKPLDHSYNFFGFTDGDRAVCFSCNMNCSEIWLYGFTFGKTIGKYSKNRLTKKKYDMKLKKFDIAKSVINWTNQLNIPINHLE